MTRSWVEVDQASIRPLESGFLKAWRRLREKEGKVLPHVSFVGSTWSDRSVFAEPDVHLAAAEKETPRVAGRAESARRGGDRTALSLRDPLAA